MNSSQQGAQPPRGESCYCCGGSGVLRTESAGYRTCLSCLGQGQLPVFERVLGVSDPAVSPELDLYQRLPKGLRSDISASTSGAR